MVSVSLTVDNKSAVLKAFEGANVAFVSHQYLCGHGVEQLIWISRS